MLVVLWTRLDFRATSTLSTEIPPVWNYLYISEQTTLSGITSPAPSIAKTAAMVDMATTNEQPLALGPTDHIRQGQSQMTNEGIVTPRMDAPTDEEKDIRTTSLKPPRDISGWKWVLAGKKHWRLRARDEKVDPLTCLTVSAILSSVFLFSLDQTIVADIIPPIVDHFGQIEKLPWVSVTLLLAAAGTINFW